jgi:hypothetical protein
MQSSVPDALLLEPQCHRSLLLEPVMDMAYLRHGTFAPQKIDRFLGAVSRLTQTNVWNGTIRLRGIR